MKVVIIGGGIAGMSLAILLHKNGYQVIVNEREEKMPLLGNAFLMHSDGVSILQLLNNVDAPLDLPGKLIDTFLLKSPDGNELKYQKLEPWQCIRRSELVKFLYQQFPKDKVIKGRVFSHFIYESGEAVAVVFQNGDVEYGDVFVGADGSMSQVRQSVFGKTNYSPVEVKEIIGVTKMPDGFIKKKGVFVKYKEISKGLSYGYIPTSDVEIVWFMQYDVRLIEQKGDTPDSLFQICQELLVHFPEDVQTILRLNDFSNSYVWNTTDFDLLDSFHSKNIILIGDAAHLALPFTSAGTTNALIDAKVLMDLLLQHTHYEEAFMAFYEQRAKPVEEHTLLGRQIKNTFLASTEESLDEIKVPLITHKASNNKLAPKFKKVHLLYFTDPVCSTCWLIQPQLRKLKLEYGDYLEIEYCMGGLLPSWDNYQRGSISKPEDAAAYWRKAAEINDMPINHEIWLEHPLTSSYPPSIAFKAAQLQDTDKAIIFLRRINEMLFVDNQNIVDVNLLYNAAYEAGLDAARFLRDMSGRAPELFKADLSLAEELAISVLPTFIFTDKFNNSSVLKGFQEYETFEKMILDFIPNAKKQIISKDYNGLFELYPTLTTKEFSFLSDLEMANAEKLLKELESNGIIKKSNSHLIGTIWKMKSPLSVEN